MKAAIFALLLAAGCCDLPIAGNDLMLWSCNASDPRQVWSVSNGGEPNDHITNIATGLVVDISEWSNATGAEVHVWSIDPPQYWNQQWKANAAAKSITSEMNGFCLEAVGMVQATKIVTNPCSGAAAQQFSFNSSTGQFQWSNPTLCMAAGPVVPDYYFSCTAGLAGGPRLNYTYCDPTKSVDDRVADLVSRMTDQEKALSLDTSNPTIPRLGVPSMPSGEGLHGVVSGCGVGVNGSTGCPTSFPCPMALGATFDTSLYQQIGAIIGTEARVLNAQNLAGLILFTPNINQLRDPRWGRAQEVPGEDPTLTSKYATAFITGLQAGNGQDSDHILVVSTAKHLSVYDMEGYQPATDPQPQPVNTTCDTPGGCQRFNFDPTPSPQDFANFYMPAFHAAVDVNVSSIMCSYNAVNGIPSCANGPIMNSLLREQWGWKGMIVSDYTALELVMDAEFTQCNAPYPPNGTCTASYFPGHDYLHTVPDSINTVLNNGVDYCLGTLFKVWLWDTVLNGSVPIEPVNLAVSRLYRNHILLGLLDPMATQPYANLPLSVVDSPAHRQVALQAAREAIVLLKNTGNILPLSPTTKQIAFIGPHANATTDLLSNYHGSNTLVLTHSPLDVALSRGLPIVYERGCNICDVVPPGYPNQICPQNSQNDTSGIPAAVAAAAAADVAVVFVGCDQTTEAESFDRPSIQLAGVQGELVSQILAAQPNTIIVFINGGIVSEPALIAAAPGVLEAWYGGELGGDAIIDVLFGAYSPSGKMPVTTYYPNITDRDIRQTDLSADGGITHEYFTGPVLFPFGFGLSYTTFQYAAAPTQPTFVTHALTSTYKRDETIASVVVDVANTGNVTSDVVILAFVASDEKLTSEVWRGHLATFDRINGMEPGAVQQVQLSLPASAFLVTLDDGSQIIRAGTFHVGVGDVNAPARFIVNLVGGEDALIVL